MINKEDIFNIEKLFSNKKIIDSKLLSDSFGINCLLIEIDDKKKYIVKYYKNATEGFNAIESETKNLVFLSNLDHFYFPKVQNVNNKYLIMSYFENNELKPEEIEDDLLNAITNLHKKRSDDFGFDFDTQIGGLKQINSKKTNWVDFYREQRLGYIFNIINSNCPMDTSTNNQIEKLITNLYNFIPEKPNASLLHGDLWEGNILFYDKKFVGFIDPGSFYGHNELEIAYLTWFNPNFIKNGFLNKYNEIINIDKEYKNYEPIYQLYYSLLNVYLWDRSYIKDVKKLLNKIKI